MRTREPGRGRRRRRGARAGLSLTELLIVITIIGVLAALLVPASHQAWGNYQATQCKMNMNTIYKAFFSASHTLPLANSWTDIVHATGASQALICPCDTIELTEQDYFIYDPATQGGEIEFGPEGDGILHVTRENILATNGGIHKIPVPPSAVFNDLESSSSVFMFTERESYELPQNVPVDIGAPGYYDRNFAETGTTIPAGTPVNSYFMHFDSTGNSRATTSGSVTFREEILGVVCLDGTLDATDAILGVTKYDLGRKSRGYEESAERVELSADRKTFIIRRYQISFPGEDCRIITKPSTEDYRRYGGSATTRIQVVGGPGAGADIELHEGQVLYLSGDLSSYAMNSQVKAEGSAPKQILLLGFERSSVAESGAREFPICFEDYARQSEDVPYVPLRHHGMVNILTVEGAVKSVEPDEINPARDREIWEP